MKNWKKFKDSTKEVGKCPVWLNASFINEASCDEELLDSDSEDVQIDKFYNAVYRAAKKRKPELDAETFYIWMQTAMEEREGF